MRYGKQIHIRQTVLLPDCARVFILDCDVAQHQLKNAIFDSINAIGAAINGNAQATVLLVESWKI
jgi:hypothetical protein